MFPPDVFVKDGSSWISSGLPGVLRSHGEMRLPFVFLTLGLFHVCVGERVRIHFVFCEWSEYAMVVAVWLDEKRG